MTAERTSTTDHIRETYADQAATFDRFAPLYRLATGRYRRRLFGRARGHVLDVACGTAVNRRYLPAGTEYVGVDLSPEMLAVAERRNPGLARGENLLEMDAGALAFEDDSFDTVISALSTCTFPDPVGALDEMARVCDPEGRVLLLEHGRSSVGPVARLQEWWAPRHFEAHACRLAQEPTEHVAAADLRVEDTWTALLGSVTGIVARPDDD